MTDPGAQPRMDAGRYQLQQQDDVGSYGETAGAWRSWRNICGRVGDPARTVWEVPADNVRLQPMLPADVVPGGGHVLCDRQLQAAVVGQGEVVLRAEQHRPRSTGGGGSELETPRRTRSDVTPALGCRSTQAVIEAALLGLTACSLTAAAERGWFQWVAVCGGAGVCGSWCSRRWLVPHAHAHHVAVLLWVAEHFTPASQACQPDFGRDACPDTASGR